MNKKRLQLRSPCRSWGRFFEVSFMEKKSVVSEIMAL